MGKFVWLVAFLFLFFSCVFSFPMQLPIQGKLKGQTAGDVNKVLPMTFSIYSVASGGAAIWSQTKNVDVNIIDADNNIGVFSSLIGDSVWLDFNSHADMNFLGIKIQSNAELSPRIRIGATAYAFVAKRLAAVEDLNIETYGYKSFGDNNFNKVFALNFFGSGASLTGIPSQADVNAAFVPYIGADYDVALGIHDLSAKDLNASSGVKAIGVFAKKFMSSDANSVYGINAVALGYLTTAFGDHSSAFGNRTTANGVASSAFGYQTVASGDYSLVSGQESVASNVGSFASGSFTTASGFSSMASGQNTIAGGNVSFASGDNAVAMGGASTAFGHDTNAFGGTSFASGYDSNAFGGTSTVFGAHNRASGNYTTVFGYGNIATSTVSTAFGLWTLAGGYASTAWGRNSVASGRYSFAGDYNSTAAGDQAIALGYYAKALGEGSVVIGYNVINEDVNSVAVGLDFNVAGVTRMHDDLNVSMGINTGVSIHADVNRICFPSNSCEFFLDYNGTAMIFGS